MDATDDALLDRLAEEGRWLAAGVGAADAAVPGLEWTARDVIAHTGAVHLWAADIVRRALATNETGGSRAFAWTGPDDALATWYLDTLEALIAALREAPADLQCFAFLRDRPARSFWIRRQAHETAIHRADVESASGAVHETPPWFAQDGLDELVNGFGTRRPFAIDRPGRLLLAATDGPSRLVMFDASGNTVEARDDGGDATVSGTSDQLYRWAWNRPVDGVDVSGDADVVAAWQHAVRIT